MRVRAYTESKIRGRDGQMLKRQQGRHRAHQGGTGRKSRYRDTFTGALFVMNYSTAIFPLSFRVIVA